MPLQETAVGLIAVEPSFQLLLSLCSLMTLVSVLTACVCCKRPAKQRDEDAEEAYGVIPADHSTSPRVTFRFGKNVITERHSQPSSTGGGVSSIGPRSSAPLHPPRYLPPPAPTSENATRDLYASIDKRGKRAPTAMDDDVQYADGPAATYDSIDADSDLDGIYSKVGPNSSNRRYDYPQFKRENGIGRTGGPTVGQSGGDPTYQSASQIYAPGSEDPYSSIASGPRGGTKTNDGDSSSAYDPGYARVRPDGRSTSIPRGSRVPDKQSTARDAEEGFANVAGTSRGGVDDERELDQLYSKIRRRDRSWDTPERESSASAVGVQSRMPGGNGEDRVFPSDRPIHMTNNDQRNSSDDHSTASRDPSYRYISVRESSDTVRERLRREGMLPEVLPDSQDEGQPRREHYYSTIGGDLYESMDGNGAPNPLSIRTWTTPGVNNLSSSNGPPLPPTSPIPDRSSLLIGQHSPNRTSTSSLHVVGQSTHHGGVPSSSSNPSHSHHHSTTMSTTVSSSSSSHPHPPSIPPPHHPHSSSTLHSTSPQRPSTISPNPSRTHQGNVEPPAHVHQQSATPAANTVTLTDTAGRRTAQMYNTSMGNFEGPSIIRPGGDTVSMREGGNTVGGKEGSRPTSMEIATQTVQRPTIIKEAPSSMRERRQSPVTVVSPAVFRPSTDHIVNSLTTSSPSQHAIDPTMGFSTTTTSSFGYKPEEKTTTTVMSSDPHFVGRRIVEERETIVETMTVSSSNTSITSEEDCQSGGIPLSRRAISPRLRNDSGGSYSGRDWHMRSGSHSVERGSRSGREDDRSCSLERRREERVYHVPITLSTSSQSLGNEREEEGVKEDCSHSARGSRNSLLPVKESQEELRRAHEKSRERRRMESGEIERKEEERREERTPKSTRSHSKGRRETEEEMKRRLGTIYTGRDYVSPIDLTTERAWPLVAQSSPPSLRRSSPSTTRGDVNDDDMTPRASNANDSGRASLHTFSTVNNNSLLNTPPLINGSKWKGGKERNL